MPPEKFGKKLLVDGNYATLQQVQLLLVIIDQDDLMSEIRKASTRNQPHVPRTDNGYLHSLNSLSET